MANPSELPVFRSWLPEWAIRAIIFLVAVPSLGFFGLSVASNSAAAGFYGIEPQDVQFSMIMFYAAVASFYSFEARLFRFVDVKNYLILSTALVLVTSYVCYSTRSLPVLFVFRFLQGMSSSASTSICITLIFGRLHSERMREVGYSVFYGILLVMSQLTILATAPLTDTVDFNVLYKAIIYLVVPATLLLYLSLNPVRLTRRIPLYQLDWRSFVLYATAIVLLGYVLIYGQQKYWFADPSITASAMGAVVLFTLYALRQRGLKRPYLSLNAFRYRHYCAGALLLMVLYLCRGSLNLTSSYLTTILGLDQWHLGIMLLANVGGVVAGVVVASRLMLMRMSVRLPWLCGFLLMFVFHIWMSLLFTSQADQQAFIVPLIVHGVGAGLLMVPIILFMISAVPQQLAQAASGTGILVRFFSFGLSIACINLFSEYSRNQHYNRFLNGLTSDNALLGQRLAAYAGSLESRGLPKDRALRAADALLSRNVQSQLQLHLSVEYYQIMAALLLLTILLIALYPYFKRTAVSTRLAEPSAVGI